jgi:hypothetical protein
MMWLQHETAEKTVVSFAGDIIGLGTSKHGAC